MDLLTALTGTAWSAVFFIVALSVIVAIHEYGHYIVGRWSGIHAEVFSVGFGPILFSRVDKCGTRWQIAAIPFGGYVKFLGDADASSVQSAVPAGLSVEERRHTMAGAPLWARASTVIAGPMANFILTFAILLGALFYTGLPVERPTVARLAPLPVEQPLRPGDVILEMNGQATPDLAAMGEVLRDLPRAAQIAFRVERDGEELSFMAPHPQPALVASVQVKSAAIDAGLRRGDVILSLDGQPIEVFSDLQSVVVGSGGRALPMTVWRDGTTFEVSLSPRSREIPRPEAEGGGFETRWMIGLASGLTFEPVTRTPGLFEAVSIAASDMWAMVTTTFSGLWHMIVGQISTCNMSGMIGIAETMGDAAKSGTMSFVTMLAVLSMGVGILNLLPIPVLDGGHLVFHAFEAVTGKPPSDAALRLLMTVGLTLLLSLMAFALWNDVTCL
ncbi:RIP metalloprotease RseP [Pseudogemmobacter faecipullorum]|uniref:Zinc metalloprotease n=1 Tax=Pseudogemmobacter faecipullorum TaxID=2755041 RepID=A0ABS8CK70_9RHOB|nr:RIP metalloprotease RseP [Pseudogemmobacter faecipullorum]MCB5409771.1 RIP metalloprotease RseP [Pseudogemmobacter faecipullorum]